MSPHVMVLLFTIAWLGSWMFNVQPELTGIKVTGDTCDASSAISFDIIGSSNSSYYRWDFGDPASGNHNTLTVDGSRGSGFPSHTFSSPGEYEVHVYFQEPGSPESRLCKEITIGNCCPTSSTSITSVSICSSELPYSWNGNSYTSAGSYKKKFPNPSGCDSIATLVLEVGNPAPFLGNDTTLCPGEKLLLNPGNYQGYQWQDLSSNPTFEVTQPGLYSVTVQSGPGCAGTDAIEVKYETNCGDIFFPSAITPNNDGNNDAFGALGNVSSVTNFQLVIYNRFGQVVFSSSNPFQRWNGLNGGFEGTNSNYVWNAAYNIHGRSQKHKKGNLVVLK